MGQAASRTIATVGECLIDFTPIESGGVTTGFEMHPGGSPLNIALAAARLGHPTAFASRVSTDFFGERIVGHLTENGIGVELLVRGAEPTTLAFVAYVGSDARYSFRSEAAADTLLSPADLPAQRLVALAALHFGSISLLHPVTAGTVLGLARQLKGRVTLTFDPNVRPTLVADWSLYAAIVHESVRLADLIRLSEEDIDAWRAATGEDLVAVALEAADRPVIVTHSARGSTLHDAGAQLEVPGRAVDVVDTVGAGDAYMGALLVGLAEAGALESFSGRPRDHVRWRAAMEFATTAAALTCRRKGADPPRRDEVDAAVGGAGPLATTGAGAVRS